MTSIDFALRGDFPWRRLPGYVLVQLAGAALACLFLLAVFGNVEHLGATTHEHQLGAVTPELSCDAVTDARAAAGDQDLADSERAGLLLIEAERRDELARERAGVVAARAPLQTVEQHVVITFAVNALAR